MNEQTCTILIGGEAGQGLVTVGHLLSRALVRLGYHIHVTQDYQSRIRGGHNSFVIRAGMEQVLAPQERIDLIVALDDASAELHGKNLTDDGMLIADERSAIDDARCLRVPLKTLAGSPRYENVAALGVAAALLGLSQETVAVLLHETFGKKDEKVASENAEALTRSYAWAGERRIANQALQPCEHPPKHLMMNGNQAIALGAIAAGLKFYSFYPMTPATSIGLSIIQFAKRMDIVVEQAEDEIAAINMALGASFAGVPSMVATSGGGFALMVEAVSLAAMTETPIVIAVAQRPGPATGLPTRTEQGDLEMVLYAGHGEFSRAIFAPRTVEECFHLTHKAFELAEQTQSPIFILTDQYLADSDRAVLPFDLDAVKPITVGVPADEVKTPYQRHALTDDGVSPRLLPGMSEHLVVTDSDEHAEDGHLTEDLEVRKMMVQKRLAKMALFQQACLDPIHTGAEEPELLLVCWGSTSGAVVEASLELEKKKLQVATLSFSQVWPLVPEKFLPLLQAAQRVVFVEGNATGQFAHLIRRETGFEIRERIVRYDGLPLTPEYILRELER